MLISIKGTIGKVAIIGDLSDDATFFPTQASAIIRLKNKKQAIIVYMFLKSDLGQFMLSRITSGTTMPLIHFADTRRFKVPMLSESEADDIVKKFEHEIELYQLQYISG